MHNVTPGERPQNDAGYLEMMTKVIFMAGLNRQVVEGKYAREMEVLAREHGSFGRWLRQVVEAEGIEATAKEIARRFKYVSEASATRYLYAVGEDVGEVSEKVRMKYGQ